MGGFKQMAIKEQSRTAAEFIKNMSEVFTPVPKERPVFWYIQDKIKSERKVVIKKQPKEAK